MIYEYKYYKSAETSLYFRKISGFVDCYLPEYSKWWYQFWTNDESLKSRIWGDLKEEKLEEVTEEEVSSYIMLRELSL